MSGSSSDACQSHAKEVENQFSACQLTEFLHELHKDVSASSEGARLLRRQEKGGQLRRNVGGTRLCRHGRRLNPLTEQFKTLKLTLINNQKKPLEQGSRFTEHKVCSADELPGAVVEVKGQIKQDQDIGDWVDATPAFQSHDLSDSSCKCALWTFC
ncbi:hypothetical protein PAMP_023316 [Pampus punctatissimus]